MKTLAILGIIAGVFLIGGIFLASAGVFTPEQDSVEDNSSPLCSETSCPTGGCTTTNNCGLATCGAVTGGSCGCN